MDCCCFIYSTSYLFLLHWNTRLLCRGFCALCLLTYSQYPEQWVLQDSAHICQVKSYSSSKSSALLQGPLWAAPRVSASASWSDLLGSCMTLILDVSFISTSVGLLLRNPTLLPLMYLSFLLLLGCCWESQPSFHWVSEVIVIPSPDTSVMF